MRRSKEFVRDYLKQEGVSFTFYYVANYANSFLPGSTKYVAERIKHIGGIAKTRHLNELELWELVEIIMEVHRYFSDLAQFTYHAANTSLDQFGKKIENSDVAAEFYRRKKDKKMSLTTRNKIIRKAWGLSGISGDYRYRQLPGGDKALVKNNAHVTEKNLLDMYHAIEQLENYTSMVANKYKHAPGVIATGLTDAGSGRPIVGVIRSLGKLEIDKRSTIASSYEFIGVLGEVTDLTVRLLNQLSIYLLERIETADQIRLFSQCVGVDTDNRKAYERIYQQVNSDVMKCSYTLNLNGEIKPNKTNWLTNPLGTWQDLTKDISPNR